MTNAERIKALRVCADCIDLRNGVGRERCTVGLMRSAADALEAAEKRIAELEDELRFQLDTRRKETAEIERLKAESLKLQKQNRDCGWNCKQCEYVDKDLQAEESEQRLMELDRRLYELRSFNAKMKGE